MHRRSSSLRSTAAAAWLLFRAIIAVGTLTLDNVTLSDCFVDGMQKVGGYVGQCGGSVTIDKCAVVDSTFRSLYQCAPVIAYAMNNQYNNDDGSNASKRANTLTINGIKLENNSVVIVKDAETIYKTFGDNVDTMALHNK